MNARRLVWLLGVGAAICLGMAFLTGCETMRVGLSTDFGTFSYELPHPTSSK
jgi:hypothetical protein